MVSGVYVYGYHMGMPLRLGVDLDGTLADLGSRLRQMSTTVDSVDPGVSDGPSDDADCGGQAVPFLSGVGALLDTPHLQGAASEVWRRVAATENFWETLEEIEQGAVQGLAELGRARRWEIIFLTSRPESEGQSTQLQSQRWLSEKGFQLPSVFVTNGSRGKIASALDLDVVLDDNPNNCIDIASDSGARAILIWRGTSDSVPRGIKKLGVGAVSTMSECFTLLQRLDDNGRAWGIRTAFRRLFGLRA